MKNTALKQASVKTKVGGFQVQLSTSFSHYIVYMNLAMMGMMFWHTTGGPFVRQFYPWVTYWMFAVFMLLIIVVVMVFDYKFMYPSRQGFLSQQSYKHSNPAVADLQTILTAVAVIPKIVSNQKRIMERLGIKDK